VVARKQRPDVRVKCGNPHFAPVFHPDNGR
jgi:hypothetical protein